MRRMNLQLDLDPDRNVLRPARHGVAGMPWATGAPHDIASTPASGHAQSDGTGGEGAVARGPRAGMSGRGEPPVLHQAVAPAPSNGGLVWFDTTADGGHTLVIPDGASIRGDCRAPNVWVHGEVRGQVVATSGVLIVAQGARVHGGVDGAGPVVLAGHVRSHRGGPAVVARGRLDIGATAHIVGTVFHDVIALYEGARVEGVLRCLRAWRGGRG